MNLSNLIFLGGGFFRWVLQTSWQAGVLAGLILVGQWLLRKRLSPAWRYGLWLLLVARLVMPLSPPSVFSIFNLARLRPEPPVPAGSSTVPAELFGSGPAAGLMAAEGRGIPLSRQGPALHEGTKADWLVVGLCGYLAGVGFFAARHVWTNRRFRARIRGYQPVTDAQVTRLLHDCCLVLKLRQPVRLIECEEVESPAVYGLGRKWLLLPDGVFERFSPAELRCIFLHELAHIKRRDLGVNWVVGWLQVVHWFNPLLWLAWARMRVDRELATDALALSHVQKPEQAPYGETILKLLEGLAGKGARPGLLGIAEGKAQLRERLAAIGRDGHYSRWMAPALVATLALIGLTDAQIEPVATSQAGAGQLPGQNWPQQALDSPPSPLAVRADHAQWDANKRQAVYYDHVVISDAQNRLACERLTLFLPPEGGTNLLPTHAVAETNLDLLFVSGQGVTNHFTADKAIYDYQVVNQVTNETVTFTGHPTNWMAQGWFTGEPMVWDLVHKTFYGGSQAESHTHPRPSPGHGTNRLFLNLRK